MRDMPHTSEVSVPTHLGLILDGNRRWAKAQQLPTFEGHRRGYENLKTIVRAAHRQGIKYVSAFVFSTENWNRSKEEVDYLMRLLLWVSKNEIKELDKENVRVLFAGTTERLQPKIIKAMRDAEVRTQKNTGGTLVLCLNYGGREEIVAAANKALKSGVKEFTEQLIEQNLYAADVPSVDLLIRTSGEQRISNFMLWRAAYSELYFTPKMWPDFSEDDLREALQDFSKRQRRFGA